jgi:3,4-dihydroxyphthalate decarboxylase
MDADLDTDADLDGARHTVALACRMLVHAGLSEDLLGHVSVRVGADRMLVRCRGPREEGLLFTTDEDVRLVDLAGTGELGEWRAPAELPIHAEVLRWRPEVDAVVHCHPPSVLVAGIAGIALRPIFGSYHIPAARLALDGVPSYPRSVLIRTPALAGEMLAAMGSSPAVVLTGHGLTTVGSGALAVEQAVALALAVETLARVNVACAAVGGPRYAVSPEDAAQLPDLGGAFTVATVWRHQRARLRHAGLDLPDLAP